MDGRGGAGKEIVTYAVHIRDEWNVESHKGPIKSRRWTNRRIARISPASRSISLFFM